MSVRRRPHGAAVDAVAIYVRVAKDAKDFGTSTARRLGVSEAAFIEELLRFSAATLDADGIPSWWTKPLPAHQEELAAS